MYSPALVPFKNCEFAQPLKIKSLSSFNITKLLIKVAAALIEFARGGSYCEMGESNLQVFF